MRWRMLLKWAGVLLCVAIALAFVASTQVLALWASHSRKLKVNLYDGALSFQLRQVPFLVATPGLQIVKPNKPGFDQPMRALVPTWRDVPSRVGGPPPYRIWRVPLWMPFALVAIPTTWLWFKDRAPRRGHCRRCGYNLTGNVSGKCPECGTAVVKNKP